MKEVIEAAYHIMQLDFAVGSYSITLWQLYIFCALCIILLTFVFGLFGGR